MSHEAALFAEGYREEPLKMDKAAGVQRLAPGQHEAIWNGDDHERIELSFVKGGHTFIVVVLDADTLGPLRLAAVNQFGLVERPVEGFELDDEGKAAIAKLRTGGGEGG